MPIESIFKSKDAGLVYQSLPARAQKAIKTLNTKFKWVDEEYEIILVTHNGSSVRQEYSQKG